MYGPALAGVVLCLALLALGCPVEGSISDNTDSLIPPGESMKFTVTGIPAQVDGTDIQGWYYWVNIHVSNPPYPMTAYAEGQINGT
jgi:hypothetical protein